MLETLDILLDYESGEDKAVISHQPTEKYKFRYYETTMQPKVTKFVIAVRRVGQPSKRLLS